MFPEGRSCHPDLSGGGAFQVSLSQLQLGMISHKKSLITIFGHKQIRQKFHQKFDIFHKKNFQQPLILLHIWYQFSNFEAKLLQK